MGESGNYGDDSWDACRMGLLSRLEPTQKPLEERVAERMAGLSVTSRQHAMARIVREEEAKSDLAPWSMQRPSRQGDLRRGYSSHETTHDDGPFRAFGGG